METVQRVNLRAERSTGDVGSARAAAYSVLAVLILWLAAFAGGFLTLSAFPGVTEQFVPAKIQANAIIASLSWFSQVALGMALVAVAIALSDYLSKSFQSAYRLALIAGVTAGMFLIAAGAGGQENVSSSVFYAPQQATAVAGAIGASDLTVINVANDLVSGGMRSTSAFAFGWAMVLWGIAALKTRRLPVVLGWITIVVGVLYGLTVWLGPLVGPFGFIGMLIWSAWLGIYLLRVKSRA